MNIVFVTAHPLPLFPLWKTLLSFVLWNCVGLLGPSCHSLPFLNKPIFDGKIADSSIFKISTAVLCSPGSPDSWSSFSLRSSLLDFTSFFPQLSSHYVAYLLPLKNTRSSPLSHPAPWCWLLPRSPVLTVSASCSWWETSSGEPIGRGGKAILNRAEVVLIRRLRSPRGGERVRGLPGLKAVEQLWHLLERRGSTQGGAWRCGGPRGGCGPWI